MGYFAFMFSLPQPHPGQKNVLRSRKPGVLQFMGSQRVEHNQQLNNNSVSLAYQLQENPGLLDQQWQKKILFSPAPLKHEALRTAGSYAETDM